MQASTAALFGTGSTPGMPRQISQTCVLGGSLRPAIEQPQNIFDRVFGWTCTSMPITTSQSTPLSLPSPLEGRGVCHHCFQLARLFVCARDSKDDVLAPLRAEQDRKSTRLNSSHQIISYAVFCLKKKKKKKIHTVRRNTLSPS